MDRNVQFIAAAMGWMACSDYEVKKIKDHPLGGEQDTSLSDLQSNSFLDTADVHRCAGELEVAHTVTYDETCAHEAETGSIESVVEWEMPQFMEYWEYGEILMAPVVGQLTDDDGDGDIDSDDTPDIVVMTDDGGEQGTTHGVLRLIPGDGLGDVRSFQMDFFEEEVQVHPYRYSNAALGDLDGDGIAEIVVMVAVIPGDLGEPGEHCDPDVPVWPSPTPEDEPPVLASDDEMCIAAAFSADLEVLWIARDWIVDCGGHAPSLADLEGDGTVEVVVGPTIIEGASGSVRAIAEGADGRYYAYEEIGMHSMVADLDMDGISEIIVGNMLVDPEGETLCLVEDLQDGFTAAADFDGDGQGEVVVVGNGLVGVYDMDCRVLASWSLEGGGTGGPPTVSDFDTDGQVEIGIADSHTYSVYESDGQVLWSLPVADESSHATGSVVFDFEADGRPEVVYADETRLWILAGEDGSIRLEDDRHASRTLHEYPTVADVDGDGSSEIIVPNGGGHLGEGLQGLYVLGPAEGSWLMSRQVWNQHAYALVNINDDLSIPSPAASNWPSHNNFRSGDPQPTPSWLASDPVPMGEICFTECPQDRLVIQVRAGNSGAVAFRSGVPVSLYTNEAEPQHLGTTWTTQEVAPGEASEVLRYEVHPDDVVDGLLWIDVDDDLGDEYVPDECDEDNNVLLFEDSWCP
jgi:outer membrane protein assembly factor BamB